MPRQKFITYLSPAKLNLGLKIINKLSDGYHSLKTVFCLIDLFDEVKIQITSNGKISLIEHNQAWSYQKDLAYKAAILLQELTGSKFGANIKVKKTIPSGSGLGGGSSNAATVLIGLNQLWKTNLSITELIALGKQLGADVPFFIYGKNAFATGIGEKLQEIQIPEQYFVLIKPSFHIATRDIFTNLTIDFSKIVEEDITKEYLLKTKENDLQNAAEKLYPELTKIILDLKTYGNPVMTGSGSVIYLGYDNLAHAKKVAKELEPLYNTYLVKSLNFSPICSSDNF